MKASHRAVGLVASLSGLLVLASWARAEQAGWPAGNFALVSDDFGPRTGQAHLCSADDNGTNVVALTAGSPTLAVTGSGGAGAPRMAKPDLSALGPPHDFAIGPNPARAGSPVTVYFVTGWSNFETEVQLYTAAGEPVATAGGPDAPPLRAIAWGSPAYAPGRYAFALAPRNDSGESLASGVYLLQVKVTNPETGEVVPTLRKVVILR